MSFNLSKLTKKSLSKSLVLFGLVVGAGMVVAGNSTVKAASINVTTTTDEFTSNGQCSLREAIASANTDTAVNGDCTSGSSTDTDIITLIEGTYNLTLPDVADGDADLDITSPNVVITGATTRSDDFRIEADDTRVMEIHADNTTLRQLSIIGGNASNGAGIRYVDDAGEGLIDDVQVVRNFSMGSGAGIYVGELNDIEIRNSYIGDNQVGEGCGAGIYSRGVLTIDSTNFIGNQAMDGAAICLNQGKGATITNSRIDANDASRNGGAIYSYRSTVMASNTEFTRNVGNISGGAIYGLNSAVFVSDSEFTGNQSENEGSVLHLEGEGMGRIDNSIIELNIVYKGRGAIVNNSEGQLEIEDTLINSNQASYDTAAVMTEAGSTTIIRRSQITNNRLVSTTTGTSAVLGLPGSNTVLERTYVSNPVETQILIANGAIVNTTGYGAGRIVGVPSMPVESNVDIEIDASTFYSTGTTPLALENSALGQVMTISNSILFGNGNCQTGEALISSLGHNISNMPCAFLVDSSDIIGDPMIDATPVLVNGTYVLRIIDAASPALDSAQEPASVMVDQRGAARPQDGNSDSVGRMDRGAYEVPVNTFQVLPSVTPTTTVEPTSTATPSTTTTVTGTPTPTRAGSVLGATTTPQPTLPNTGSSTVLSILMGAFTIAAAIYVIVRNRIALATAK